MKKTLKVFLLSISLICSILVVSNTFFLTGDNQLSSSNIMPLGDDDDIRDIHNHY